MGFQKEKIRQIYGLMIFAAVLVLVVMHSSTVLGGIAFVFGISKPFLYGAMIAFVLNLPMRAIEEKVLGKWKGKIADKVKRPVSMLLAIIVLILVIMLVIATVVPQIKQAAEVLGNKVPVYWEMGVKALADLSVNYPELQVQLSNLQEMEINWGSLADKVIGFLKNGVGSMLTSTVTVAGSIINGVVNIVIAFIFSLYILSQKETLAAQGSKLIRAYLSPKNGDRILKVLGLLHRNFANFITGQCVEAVILGTLFIIAMSIFRMPYAFMVGVLIAFTSLIPVVGAFIGCAVGVFLILIENPIVALWFVILFLIIQQLEGNLIYPKVVGNSVGLPSIWVLMAVSLGGSLFGVAGMLFFIPLSATFYALLRENVRERNARKQEEEQAEEPDADVDVDAETVVCVVAENVSLTVEQDSEE